MLWDNTLYAYHNPPHFFLDPWITEYPQDFAEASSGEVHLNAGSGEAYKAGLFAAADRLWNPETYDPERAMRNGLAAVIGPKAVDAALDFRDLYYEMYDHYSTALGPAKKLLALLETMEARPLDDDDLAELRGILDRLPEAKGGNVLANPGAEEGEQTPVGWRTYTGAGEATLTRDESEVHSGQASGLLEATEWYQMPKGPWINVAAVISGSNGFTAGDAPEIMPFTKYHFRCWMKGDLPKVSVILQCWAEGGAAGDRRGAIGGLKETIKLTDEWQLIETSFITPADAARAAVKIGPAAYQEEGAALGKVWIDDVYLGRGKPEE